MTPNILFIILDTQRRDRLSLYGHTRPTSPRLDDFAAQTRVYQRAIAPAQWTVASHASMFTGLYPGQHGMTQAHHRLSAGFPTAAELLTVQGYHTAGFCNNPLVGLIDNGLTRGFEQFYHYASPAPNRPASATLPAPLREIWSLFSQFTRRTINRFAHDDRLFRLSLLPVFTQVWSRLVNYKGSTRHSTRDLGDYWHRHVSQSRQPLFAYLNLMGTHMPLRPPQATIERLSPEMKGSRAAYRWMSAYNGDGLRWISPLATPLTDWQEAALGSFYDAEAAEQDALLGQMLQQMDARGDLDNTLVIIGADHGEGLGDHDYCGHSFVVNQELTHVPWLMRWPGVLPTGNDDRNISTRRVFHTLLDAAQAQGVLPAEDPNSQLERLSLLTAHDVAEANTVYSEAHPPLTLLHILERQAAGLVANRGLTEVRRSITHDDYKLTAVGATPEALYFLPTDPAETHNLIQQQPDQAVGLHAQLQAFIGAQQPPSQPATNAFSPQVLENLRALGYVE